MKARQIAITNEVFGKLTPNTLLVYYTLCVDALITGAVWCSELSLKEIATISDLAKTTVVKCITSLKDQGFITESEVNADHKLPFSRYTSYYINHAHPAGNFTLLPTNLHHLSGTELLVFAALRRYSNIYPMKVSVAKSIGISINTLDDALSSLKAKGLIDPQTRFLDGRQKANKYLVVDDIDRVIRVLGLNWVTTIPLSICSSQLGISVDQVKTLFDRLVQSKDLKQIIYDCDYWDLEDFDQDSETEKPQTGRLVRGENPTTVTIYLSPEHFEHTPDKDDSVDYNALKEELRARNLSNGFFTPIETFISEVFPTVKGFLSYLQEQAEQGRIKYTLSYDGGKVSGVRIYPDPSLPFEDDATVLIAA